MFVGLTVLSAVSGIRLATPVMTEGIHFIILYLINLILDLTHKNENDHLNLVLESVPFSKSMLTVCVKHNGYYQFVGAQIREPIKRPMYIYYTVICSHSVYLLTLTIPMLHLFA